jgi:hypothetical protein
LKYIVSYNTKFGTISAESKKPLDLVEAYSELRKLAAKIEKSSKPEVKDREGKGETTEILRVLESKLLSTDYFSNPRTTGETRDKISQTARKQFTSRKVSQALGILREKGVLRRTGRRNFFKYSTR